MLLHVYKWKAPNEKIKISFIVKFHSEPTSPSHCQCRGGGQGMKQTYLYLWHPLFQAQWDICDKQNQQT